ncbi:UDP-N-acetylglucosamine 1-carboxyvinyltransferase 1 [compost metagenome]
MITETVFENRFMHVEEFQRMSAHIKVDGRSAIITGGLPLVGAKVCATDLRAGAALICAALRAEGETEVTGLHHIDRGYVNITGKLAALGADIYRVDSVQSEIASTSISNSSSKLDVIEEQILVPAKELDDAVVAISSMTSDSDASSTYKREKEVPVLKVQPTWA